MKRKLSIILFLGVVLIGCVLVFKNTSKYSLLYSKTGIGSEENVKGKFVPENTTDYIFVETAEGIGRRDSIEIKKQRIHITNKDINNNPKNKKQAE